MAGDFTDHLKEALKNPQDNLGVISSLLASIGNEEILSAEAKMLAGVASYYTGDYEKSVRWMEEAIAERPEKVKWKEHHRLITEKISRRR